MICQSCGPLAGIPVRQRSSAVHKEYTEYDYTPSTMTIDIYVYLCLSTVSRPISITRER